MGKMASAVARSVEGDVASEIIIAADRFDSKPNYINGWMNEIMDRNLAHTREDALDVVTSLLELRGDSFELERGKTAHDFSMTKLIRLFDAVRSDLTSVETILDQIRDIPLQPNELKKGGVDGGPVADRYNRRLGAVIRALEEAPHDPFSLDSLVQRACIREGARGSSD